MMKLSGVSVLALFVAACGGGGGSPGTSPLCASAACQAEQAPSSPSPSPAPSPAPAPAPSPGPAPSPSPNAGALEGFFTGTANGTPSGNYTFGLVVLENSELWGVYIRGNLIYGAVHGTVQAADGSFTGAGFDFNIPSGARTPATVSGTYQAGVSIAGSGSPTGSFAGTYDASYNTPATLASIQGTWTGQVVTRIRTENSRVTIGADGAFSGNVSSCNYTGSAAPRPGGKNVFDMTVTFAVGGCLFDGKTVTGIALVSGGKLITLALLPDGSDGFMAIAAR